jgi:single-stranded-DNA-specific exonuclease
MKIKLLYPDLQGPDYGASLLKARGIQNIQKFMEPDESCLQDWHNLDNIMKGISLIQICKQDGARVCLVVDCDVDGYTSAAIMYQYLMEFNPSINLSYYLHDGKAHGLEEHWNEFAMQNYDLLIIPDAGSNDSQHAQEISCPILVLDHHILEDDNVAPNMVIINNQTSVNYSNKSLSGAGVVYQFCRGIDEVYGTNYVTKYIDLAALGICGDMMSGLETENQYFWHKGFKNLQNYFIWCIARKQGYSITGKLHPTDDDIIEALNPISVAFYIVPLINAMIRVGTMDEKERMFIAFIDGHRMIPCNKRGAKGTLEEAAVESTRECVNARSHQNKTKDNAVAQVEQKIFKHDLLDNQILFIRLDDSDQYPSELNGLLANQLAQKYHHPTIIARLNDEGYIRGSARGLSNTELISFKDYLNSTGLFEYTAGHDNAFGISIKNADLDRLHELANHDLAQYDFGSGYYEVDFSRPALANDIDKIIESLDNYKQNWSQNNGEPLIYISGIHFSKKDVTLMGKNNSSVKIIKNGIAYVKFNATDMIDEINMSESDNLKMDVVGRGNLNFWNGSITPQIMVDHYEIHPDSILDF